MTMLLRVLAAGSAAIAAGVALHQAMASKPDCRDETPLTADDSNAAHESTEEVDAAGEYKTAPKDDRGAAATAAAGQPSTAASSRTGTTQRVHLGHRRALVMAAEFAAEAAVQNFFQKMQLPSQSPLEWRVAAIAAIAAEEAANAAAELVFETEATHSRQPQSGLRPPAARPARPSMPHATQSEQQKQPMAPATRSVSPGLHSQQPQQPATSSTQPASPPRAQPQETQQLPSVPTAQPQPAKAQPHKAPQAPPPPAPVYDDLFGWQAACFLQCQTSRFQHDAVAIAYRHRRR